MLRKINISQNNRINIGLSSDFAETAGKKPDGKLPAVQRIGRYLHKGLELFKDELWTFSMGAFSREA